MEFPKRSGDERGRFLKTETLCGPAVGIRPIGGDDDTGEVALAGMPQKTWIGWPS